MHAQYELQILLSKNVRIHPYHYRHRLGQQYCAGTVPRLVPVYGGFTQAGNGYWHGFSNFGK